MLEKEPHHLEGGFSHGKYSFLVIRDQAQEHPHLDPLESDPRRLHGRHAFSSLACRPTQRVDVLHAAEAAQESKAGAAAKTRGACRSRRPRRVGSVGREQAQSPAEGAPIQS